MEHLRAPLAGGGVVRIDKKTPESTLSTVVSFSHRLQHFVVQLDGLFPGSFGRSHSFIFPPPPLLTMRVLSLFALVAPLVSAIQFREPAINSTLAKGEMYNVKWDSVDTDPSKFSIYLVNFVNWPPFYTQIASDVETSAGQHDVAVPCAVASSGGFQL